MKPLVEHRDLEVTAHWVQGTPDEEARGAAAYEGEVRLFTVPVFTYRTLVHRSVSIDYAVNRARELTGAAFAHRLRDLLATEEASAPDPATCPDGPHVPPAGPNEDTGQCPTCWAPVGVLRPENEQYGLHLDDCSLPRRHRGRCVGGGTGHAPVEIVRGYWPGMDDDIAAARERHPS